MEQRGASRRLQEQRSEAEESAGRRLEGDDRAPLIAGADVDDATFARRERLRHRPDVVAGHVDDPALDRLVQDVVDRSGDDLRARHLELVALTAHGLDQHGQLQFTASGDLLHLRRLGLSHPDRHVAEHLTCQPLAKVAAGQELSLASRQR
jgi:hypothetical protein